MSLVSQKRDLEALDIAIHIHLLEIPFDGVVVVVLGLEKAAYYFFQH